MESIIALFQKYAMKAQSGLSGFQAVLVGLFVEYVVNHIKKFWQKIQHKKTFDKKLDVYEASVKDESLSEDKKNEALDNFLK